MCVCVHVHVGAACGGQERVSDPLGLELDPLGLELDPLELELDP